MPLSPATMYHPPLLPCGLFPGARTALPLEREAFHALFGGQENGAAAAQPTAHRGFPPGPRVQSAVGWTRQGRPGRVCSWPLGHLQAPRCGLWGDARHLGRLVPQLPSARPAVLVVCGGYRSTLFSEFVTHLNFPRKRVGEGAPGVD